MNEITSFNASGVDAAETEQMPHSIEAEQQLLGAILTALRNWADLRI